MKVRKTELKTGATEIVNSGSGDFPDQWMVDLAKSKQRTASEIYFKLYDGQQMLHDGYSYDAAKYPDTLALAALFSRLVRARTSPEEMLAIVQENAEAPDSTICHSHDFIDANVAMSDAWEALTGETIDQGNDRMLRIWNTAWAIARHYGFAEESATGGA